MDMLNIYEWSRSGLHNTWSEITATAVDCHARWDMGCIQPMVSAVRLPSDAAKGLVAKGLPVWEVRYLQKHILRCQDQQFYY